MSRAPDEPRVERLEGLELAYGDAADRGAMEKALRGVDAFVHIAGIEYTPHVWRR